MSCIFCQIVNKELPSEVAYEDQEILGFKNIDPKAPLHLLFIPKQHLEWNQELSGKDSLIFSKIIAAAQKTAAEKKVDQAYKLIFNVGKTGEISHIHLHLLGGWTGNVPMNNI